MIASMWNLTRAPTYRYGVLADPFFVGNTRMANTNTTERCPQTSSSFRERTASKSDKKFKVMLNVKNFEPDEIDVKIVDGFVVVHCKHEERFDEHGFVAREFTRRYKIPDDVEHGKVTSKLSSNDILTIKAPRKKGQLPKNERVIPITMHPSVVAEAAKIF